MISIGFQTSLVRAIKTFENIPILEINNTV
jgi:hypothetical protein